MVELTYHIETLPDGTEVRIPDLAAPEPPEEPLTKYGLMRMEYLKEHQNWVWQCMVMDGSLWNHCLEIQKQAEDRLENMMPRMMKAEGVTEELKRKDPLVWVGRMNMIRAQIEETIFHDLIYC